jgi:flagellin
MISVRTNPIGLLAMNQFAAATRALNTSLERLATGKRINRASDDPAGAMAVTDLDGQRKSLRAKIDRMRYEATYVGARDGAQAGLSDLMARLNGYVVTAANTACQSREEREALQMEVDAILSAIDNAALTTTFNGQKLLGNEQAANLGVTLEKVVGPDGKEAEVRYTLADLRTGGKLNLLTGDLEKAQNMAKGVGQSVAQSRAMLGARANQIDAELQVAENEYINLTDAQSKIEDTDYAKEVSALMRAQVLQQAAAFAIRLAQNSPQNALSLLKPLDK